MAGWLVSVLAAYLIGRWGAAPLLHRLIGERRFRRAEQLVDRGGVTALLAARLDHLSASDPVVWVAVGVPLTLLVTAHVVGRRIRRRDEAPVPTGPGPPAPE